MSKTLRFFLILLVLINATVWLAVLFYPKNKLKIIACDVGQGDAFLVIRGKVQVVIDGGPNKKIVDCLDRYIPFWDRKIEIVVLSHPQKDHYMGLIEVFRRYKVEAFVSSGVDSGSQEFGLLKMQVGGSGARVINATKGMVIRLGLIYLDILHPSEEFLAENSKIKTKLTDSKKVSTESGNQGGAAGGVLGIYEVNTDPNEFSMVFILSYKDFKALFTGDIDNKISDMVADVLSANDRKTLDYIKIPHHGSKNGLSQRLLQVAEPDIAVISVGKDNSYGHPHKEILDLLKRYRLVVLRTDELGDILIETDGEKIFRGKSYKTDE